MKVCEKCGKTHRTVAKFRTELCSVCAFWASVTVKGLDDCWLWDERLDKDGYGDARFVRFNGKKERHAHRIAWALENGPIPDGMSVLHCCDDRYPVDDKTNRKCVNPAHLKIGTPADNAADCKKHGRLNTASGNNNGARKHPERLRRGDEHFSKKNPEKVARGERSGARLHPEKMARTGKSHWSTRLTEDQVREIRLSGEPVSVLSARYNVCGVHIHNIISRKKWKHVT